MVLVAAITVLFGKSDEEEEVEKETEDREEAVEEKEEKEEEEREFEVRESLRISPLADKFPSAGFIDGESCCNCFIINDRIGGC